jgi:type IV fimbrial biogenesis protein FimT
MRTRGGAVVAAGRICRSARGLTLIEMMTTLAVLVIALTLAAPALTSFLRSSRLQSVQSELVSSLMLARSEAARQGKRVGVEASGAGFANGWRVWVDANANGVYDSGEPVVREVPAHANSLTITTTLDVRDVVFAPSGFLVDGSAVIFDLCAIPAGAKGYRVQLEPVGLSDVTEVTSCS